MCIPSVIMIQVILVAESELAECLSWQEECGNMRSPHSNLILLASIHNTANKSGHRGLYRTQPNTNVALFLPFHYSFQSDSSSLEFDSPSVIVSPLL